MSHDVERGYKEFEYAVVNRKIDLLKDLIASEKYDVNTVNAQLWTPLHRAALVGNAEAAFLLLRHGADQMAQDILGQTPLFLAALNNRHEVMDAIISRTDGLACGLRNIVGDKPLSESVRKGDKKGVEILLKSRFYRSRCGEDELRRCFKQGLFHVGRNQETIVLMMIECGFHSDRDVERKMEYVEDIVKSGKLRCIRILLQNVTRDLEALKPLIDSERFYKTDYHQIITGLLRVGYTMTSHDMEVIKSRDDQALIKSVQQYQRNSPSLLHLSRIKVRAILCSKANTLTKALELNLIYLPRQITDLLLLNDTEFVIHSD